MSEQDVRINKYEREMIDRSGANEVACKVARELIFHWIHQLNPDYAGYDPAMREQLVLICRGARQVPGMHHTEIGFVTEFARLVEIKLHKMYKDLFEWADTDNANDVWTAEFGKPLEAE